MTVSGISAAPAPPSPRAGKYLTFFLGGEEYALQVMKVCEIIGMQAITRIPRTPDFIRGVINLRGRVIPITDLRLKFDMQVGENDSCIIVVQLADVQMGVVVDRVSDVVAIAEEDIEDSPSFGSGVRIDLLLGISKAGGKVKLLLDIDRVLSPAELSRMNELSASTC